MREHFTNQSLNAYLDTAGGQALVAMHGGRAQAAQALATAEAADRAWRREVAVGRAEVQAGRWPSVDDAMIATPDPLGGGGAQLAGTEQDIASAARRADPARPWIVVQTTPDAMARAISQGPGTGPHPADTRPPWRRED